MNQNFRIIDERPQRTETNPIPPTPFFMEDTNTGAIYMVSISNNPFNDRYHLTYMDEGKTLETTYSKEELLEVISTDIILPVEMYVKNAQIS